MTAAARPKKVLLVEDELLVAMLIEDMLAEMGFEVIGPAARLERALTLARDQEFDVAVLDVNLASERSFPVADLLRQRGIPFVFATGYGAHGVHERFADVPVLQKPFEAHQLERTLRAVLASS